MPVTLNQVQKDFVNTTVRKFVEDVVSIAQLLDDYVDDHDNQQDPIPSTGGTLNDGVGDNPRTDAPEITAELLATIRTVAGTIRGSVTQPVLDGAIAAAVANVSAMRSRRIV